jgi:hypothetical protein
MLFNVTSYFATTNAPRSLLTDDQKNLFNGFDEIGGDITMYDDAAEWYEKVEYKNEAMALCIAMLDKPSPWLFGGISNEKRKAMMSTVTKMKELDESINKATSDDNVPTIYQQASVMMSLDENMSITDDNVIGLKTAKKKSLSVMLCRSMSMYTENEIMSFEPEQLQKMALVRCWWVRPFQLVNVSRMKRVALMYMELCTRQKIRQALQWEKNHGGKPSRVTSYGKNLKTTEILKLDIENFVSKKSYWIRHKETFDISIRADKAVRLNKIEISGVQANFISCLSLPYLVNFKYDQDLFSIIDENVFNVENGYITNHADNSTGTDNDSEDQEVDTEVAVDEYGQEAIMEN